MLHPFKALEISIMRHEEEIEIEHDISKLREQAQQLSLSQRETKNE